MGDPAAIEGKRAGARFEALYRMYYRDLADQTPGPPSKRVAPRNRKRPALRNESR